MAKIGGSFDPEVTMGMELVLGKITTPLVGSPTVLSYEVNVYHGGPPTIKYFTVDPYPILLPGRPIHLSWSVSLANKIEIVAPSISGSPQHELPPITTVLTYTILNTTIYDAFSLFLIDITTIFWKNNSFLFILLGEIY